MFAVTYIKKSVNIPISDKYSDVPARAAFLRFLAFYASVLNKDWQTCVVI